jgi:hypothetical protein
MQTPVRLYLCPGDPSAPLDGLGTIALGPTLVCPGPLPTTYVEVGLTSYAANAQVFGKFDQFGNFVSLDGKTRPQTDISDGTSNTILFTERYANAGFYNDNPLLGPGGNAWAWWGIYPSNSTPPIPPVAGVTAPTLNLDTPIPAFALFAVGPGPSAPQIRPSNFQSTVLNVRPSSPHTGVIIVGMADGSTRTVSEGISPFTWWAACTPNGSELLPADW